MSWGTGLWDGEKHLASYTENTLQEMTAQMNFLKKVSEIQTSFSKDLRSLIKAQKTLSPETTGNTAWNSILSETDDIAKQHDLIGEAIQTNVVNRMKQTHKKIKAEREAVFKKVKECQKEVDKISQKHESLQKTSHKADKDEMDVQTKLDNAESKNDMQKIKKLTHDKDETARKAREARDDMIAMAYKLEQGLQKFYDADIRDLFDRLQSLEEERLQNVASVFKEYGTILEQRIPVYQQCVAGIITTSDNINTAQDTKAVLDKFHTGTSIDAFIEAQCKGRKVVSVQQVHDRRVNKTKIFKTTARKKLAIREDFGHLPPHQRKRAIEEKLEGLRKEKEKMEKEMAGITKTMELYTAQPELGSASALSKLKTESESGKKKLQDLERDIMKFDLYLSAIDESMGDTLNVVRAPPVRKSISRAPPPPPGQTGTAKPSNSPVAGRRTIRPGVPDTERSAITLPPPRPVSEQQAEQVQAAEEFDDEFDEFDDFDHLPATALYDFAGQEESELALKAGEALTVLEDDGSGWFRVVNSDGEEGFAPASYIQLT
eukprot:m.58416 g.58416  ORF g.58416 m.58416 type:complete len:546 (-) comp11180_c0_seq3:75-1712(-)